jgi:hypothetical protein
MLHRLDYDAPKMDRRVEASSEPPQRGLRDSFFHEPVLWQGQPVTLRCPPMYRAFAGFFLVTALAALLFAALAALSLSLPPGKLLVSAALWGTLAVIFWRGPIQFRSRLEFQLTEGHIIWKRGRLRRTMERRSISYALIHWRSPGVGDLSLVRAVPTGALRRTLTIVLPDIREPDRVWAKIRGAEENLAMGHGPVSMRLDVGERILWSGVPERSPWTFRRAGLLVLGGTLVGTLGLLGVRLLPTMYRVYGAFIKPYFAMYLTAVVLSLLALALGAAYLVWSALFVPRRLRRKTRYYVTDQRVIVCRAHEELSLSRTKVAYVLAFPPVAQSELLRARDSLPPESVPSSVRGSRASLAPASIEPGLLGKLRKRVRAGHWFGSRVGARTLRSLHLVLDDPRARSVALADAFTPDLAKGDALTTALSMLSDAEVPLAILSNTEQL